jgi:hypothetical protein
MLMHLNCLTLRAARYNTRSLAPPGSFRAGAIGGADAVQSMPPESGAANEGWLLHQALMTPASCREATHTIRERIGRGVLAERLEESAAAWNRIQ